MPVEFFFEDRAALFVALQSALCARLQSSLSHAAHTTLLLSGGTTPAPLYRSLATTTLPWDRIHVALVDERWVEPDDKASNEALLRSTLLTSAAARSSFTGMKNAHPLGPRLQDSAHAVAVCNANYARLPCPWSAALLGMGADGHTASLFPHAKGLDQALQAEQYCAAVHALPSGVTGPHTERMTLTPWALLRCEHLFLLITGEDKRAVYEAARNSNDPAALPVSVLLRQRTVPLEVYWCP